MSRPIPPGVRADVYKRADCDGTAMCEAVIRLPKSFGAEYICQGRATNIHHRINRSVGGGHDLSSLLALCGSGTTGCHGWITQNPSLAREFGWSLRSTDDPRVRRVLYRGRMALLTDDGTVEYEEM